MLSYFEPNKIKLGTKPVTRSQERIIRRGQVSEKIHNAKK